MSKMTRKAENNTLHRPMDVTLNPGAPLLVETGLWAQLCSYLTPLKRTLWLFFPIFIGQLAATSMGVVDTVMAGAAGTLQLSGVAIGSSIFRTVLVGLARLMQCQLQPRFCQIFD